MKPLRSVFSAITTLIVLITSLSPAFADEVSSLSQDNAQQAVIVAFTNLFAEDVLSSDGSSFDSSKYHGINYDGQYKMKLSKDGVWAQTSENTWHVDNLYLKLTDFPYNVRLSCDVSFENGYYTLSAINYVSGYALNFDEKEKNNSLEVKYLDPDSKYSMLSVPENYVNGNGGNNIEPDDIVAYSPQYGWSYVYDYWINQNFSMWDNSNKELNRMIKNKLNDEKSFKHKKTTLIKAINQSEVERINKAIAGSGFSNKVQLNDVFIAVDFSAKNGFNATVKARAFATLSYRTNELVLIQIQ